MFFLQITQYSCDYNNLAPSGCTQYFFGPTTDTVKTFNYDGGTHLADQDQNICVRYLNNVYFEFVLLSCRYDSLSF